MVRAPRTTVVSAAGQWRSSSDQRPGTASRASRAHVTTFLDCVLGQIRRAILVPPTVLRDRRGSALSRVVGQRIRHERAPWPPLWRPVAAAFGLGSLMPPGTSPPPTRFTPAGPDMRSEDVVCAVRKLAPGQKACGTAQLAQTPGRKDILRHVPAHAEPTRARSRIPHRSSPSRDGRRVTTPAAAATSNRSDRLSESPCQRSDPAAGARNASIALSRNGRSSHITK